DFDVTGVQTCALPIFLHASTSLQSSTVVVDSFGEWPTTMVLDCKEVAARKIASQISFEATTASRMVLPRFSAIERAWEKRCCSKIGRASCREGLEGRK